MATGREIVTLQFGHYSNFIGAHWWNIQELGFEYNVDKPSEINHDVLFREGQTSNGTVTFTPRLLLVDLKGSLGHLPKLGELYDVPLNPNPSEAQWPEEKVELMCTQKVNKNEFLEDLDNIQPVDQDDQKKVATQEYNLDNIVNVWADFLRMRYHPRTVTLVNDYEFNSTTQPFEVFNQGSNSWKNVEEDFTDQIRNYAEECDNMQGFHVLLDGSDGFSGLGTSAVQYLKDEYSSKSILAFPTIPGAYSSSNPKQDSTRTMNLALTFHSLAEHSSLFVPLSTGSLGWRQPGAPREFPHLLYNSSLAYHSSAILATALETLTLRHRLQGSCSCRMSELCHDMSRLGRRAAAASVGLPFRMEAGSFLLETLEKWEGPLWRSLSPNCCLEDDRIWIQSVTLRGVAQDRLRRPLTGGSNRQDANPAYSCSSVQEMLTLFLSCCSYATCSNVTTAEVPCNVSTPYPQIFADSVAVDGSVSGDYKRPGVCNVRTVPTIAGLHSSSSVGTMVESLHKQASRLHLKRFHQFQSTGLESDEYRECLEQLLALRECYHEEFDV